MQIHIKLEADTLEEVLQQKEDYLHNYHPAGYSTSIGKPVEEDGKWICRGYRFSSCD